MKDLRKKYNDIKKNIIEERKQYDEVLTPFSIVDEMLDILPKKVWSNPNLKWLDPSAGFGTFSVIIIERLMNGLKDFIIDKNERYDYICENMIYICELNESRIEFYKNIFGSNVNIYHGSFLEKGFDKHKEKVWGINIFDICVSNPPFVKKHLKFLTKSYNISNICIYIQPSKFILDLNYSYKMYRVIYELIKNDLIYCKIFNGNKLFNIKLIQPLVISYFNKNLKHDNIKVVNNLYDNINYFTNLKDVNKLNNNKEIFSILNKVKSKTNKNIKEVSNEIRKNEIRKKYWFYLPCIRGGVIENRKFYSNNSSTLFSIKNDKYYLQKKESGSRSDYTRLQFTFDSEIEVNNFIHYLKSYLVRFLVFINKPNLNLDNNETIFVPYLNFNYKWDDDKLKEYFDITDDEYKFIREIIPKYYDNI